MGRIGALAVPAPTPTALAPEAVVLTFLTSLWRPRYERLAGLVSLGAFAWALWSARQTRDAYAATQAYVTFMRARYPPEFLWRGGELAAVEQVSRSGELVVALTAGALQLGALLPLTHWRKARRRHAVRCAGWMASPADRGADEQELDITYLALHDPVQVPLPDEEVP